jgi:hypothetical protein
LWSAVSLTPLTNKKVDFLVEYLREYEAICRRSGAQMELFDEKKGGRKSRDRVPLKRNGILIYSVPVLQGPVGHSYSELGLPALTIEIYN